MTSKVPALPHAELGASNSPRWIACPGSVALCRGLPDEATEYAAEGTVAHHVLESSLKTDTSPSEFLGEEFEIEGFQIVVDDEMVDSVQEVMDYVASRVVNLEVHNEVELRFERRVSLEALNPPAPMFGTVDIQIHATSKQGLGSLLEIVDFKYGRGIFVEAKGNSQIRYYMLGSSLEFGGASPYVGTIVQPRYPDSRGKTIRSERLGPLELLDFSADLMEAAHRTQEPNAPLNPGDHCQFCPAAGTCPALRKKALQVAQEDFGILPEPASLTPDQLGELLEKADLVQQWMDSVREHAYRELQAGREVPGYRLAPRQARRRWKDEEQAIEYLKGNYIREALDLLLPPTLVSPAKAEKILGKKHYPDHLVEKASSGLKMVREDHPAARIAAGPEADFTFEELMS